MSTRPQHKQIRSDASSTLWKVTAFLYYFMSPCCYWVFFPWSGWLPFAWYQAFQSWRNWRRTFNQPAGIDNAHSSLGDPRLDWFAAVWVVGNVLFFHAVLHTITALHRPALSGSGNPDSFLLVPLYDGTRYRGCLCVLHAVMLTGLLLAAAFVSLPWAYDNFVVAKLTEEFPLAGQFSLGNGPYLAATALLVGMGLLGYFGLSPQQRAEGHFGRPADHWPASC